MKTYNKSTNKRPVLSYEIDIDKFWSKIDRRGPDECWNWLAGQNTTGYGLFSVRNTQAAWELTGRSMSQVLAHRVVAALSGDLKQEQYVMHKCDNTLCCNPGHLQIGTQQDNVNNMISKGRGFWQK